MGRSEPWPPFKKRKEKEKENLAARLRARSADPTFSFFLETDRIEIRSFDPFEGIVAEGREPLENFFSSQLRGRGTSRDQVIIPSLILRFSIIQISIHPYSLKEVIRLRIER